MATVYTVNTASKFAYFIDEPDIEDVDPLELLEKVKRESEQQKLANDKLKKEEKERSKKGKTTKTTGNSQQPAPAPKEVAKATQNNQTNKPPRLAKAKPNNDNAGVTTGNAAPKEQHDSSAHGGENAAGESPTRPLTSNRSRGSGGYRGRGAPRGGGRGRGGFQDSDVPAQVSEGGQEFRRSNPNYRGASRGRGGRGRGSGHEFDRHSGSRVTGVKPVDKKAGAGQYNWGTNLDEEALIDGQALQEGRVEVHPEVVDTVYDAEGEEKGANTTEKENNAEAAEEGEEGENAEESKEVTLQEYLANCEDARKRFEGLQSAAQKSKKRAVPIPQSKEFAGMVAYVKKGTEGDTSEEDEEEGEEDLDDSKKKKVLEVPVRFNNRYRGGGNDRPRGTFTRGRGEGFRGGRGRGEGFRGGRGGRGNARGGSGAPESNVNLHLDSEVDFPALG